MQRAVGIAELVCEACLELMRFQHLWLLLVP